MIIDFLMFTSKPSTKQWLLISFLYIETLCEAIWSSIPLHQGPPRSNGHWFLCHIETLYMVMVIESFKYRPSPRDWSNLFFKRSKYKKNMVFRIGNLYMVMVIDLFESRPSARHWSLISYATLRPSVRQWSSISLHQGPLRGNGHWFLMSHRGPLRSNGLRSLYIKTLCEAMVIDSFVTSRPFTKNWSLISFLSI